MKNASFYILAILVLGLVGNPLSQHALNYQYNTHDNDNMLGVNAFAESDEDEQESHDDEQEREHDDESDENNEENDDVSNDSEDEEHEDETLDEENVSEEDAKEAISDAHEEIKKSQEKITEAKQKGKDTSASEVALKEAQNKLKEAQQNLELGSYEMAEEFADEAENLASDARMSLLGKSIEDDLGADTRDDESEDESEDETEDEDTEDNKDDESDTDNSQDRQKSEAKTEQIISKLEQKIEQLEQRIQSLLEKVQNGKYFGNLENPDQITKSYTISFDGTATSIQDQGVSAPLSADIFVETLVTKDGYNKLRVTGGQIDIGQTTYDIVFGKARVTDNSSDQGSFILLVAEIMDDNGGITTIRMNLDSAQSFQMADTQPADLQIGSPQSKIAGQWFLDGTGSLSS